MIVCINTTQYSHDNLEGLYSYVLVLKHQILATYICGLKLWSFHYSVELHQANPTLNLSVGYMLTKSKTKIYFSNRSAFLVLELKLKLKY